MIESFEIQLAICYLLFLVLDALVEISELVVKGGQDSPFLLQLGLCFRVFALQQQSSVRDEPQANETHVPAHRISHPAL